MQIKWVPRYQPKNWRKIQTKFAEFGLPGLPLLESMCQRHHGGHHHQVHHNRHHHRPDQNHLTNVSLPISVGVELIGIWNQDAIVVNIRNAFRWVQIQMTVPRVPGRFDVTARMYTSAPRCKDSLTLLYTTAVAQCGPLIWRTRSATAPAGPTTC